MQVMFDQMSRASAAERSFFIIVFYFPGFVVEVEQKDDLEIPLVLLGFEVLKLEIKQRDGFGIPVIPLFFTETMFLRLLLLLLLLTKA